MTPRASSTKTKDEPPQKAYRRKMHKELSRVRNLADHYVRNSIVIKDNDLDTFGIKVEEDISLDPDAIDFGTRFCKPFPASRLEEIYKTRWFDEEQLGEFPEKDGISPAVDTTRYFARYLGHYDLDRTFAASSPWTDIGYSRHLTLQAGGHYSMAKPGWTMTDIYRLRDGSMPHTAFTLCDYCEVAPTDSLRATEVLCAATKMKGALRLDKKREFKVAPVLIYSFSHRHLRFLQAHFDGEAFVIRKTQWIYFDDGQDVSKKVDLVLQWMMCIPIGSTRFSPLPSECSGEHTGQEEGSKTIALRYKEERREINV